VTKVINIRTKRSMHGVCQAGGEKIVVYTGILPITR
jgi:hypothetical protein